MAAVFEAFEAKTAVNNMLTHLSMYAFIPIPIRVDFMCFVLLLLGLLF